MTEDKPLHVQVAEALGWVDAKPESWEGHKSKTSWRGILPPTRGWIEIPRYDTDWSATGPLIARREVESRGFVLSRGWI